jgi:hypothetical protein
MMQVCVVAVLVMCFRKVLASRSVKAVTRAVYAMQMSIVLCLVRTMLFYVQSLCVSVSLPRLPHTHLQWYPRTHVQVLVYPMTNLAMRGTVLSQCPPGLQVISGSKSKLKQHIGRARERDKWRDSVRLIERYRKRVKF